MEVYLFSVNRVRSGAGYRPAAVLLHTAETDGAFIDIADNLGVACLQLPAPAVLRGSVRSVWDLGELPFRPQGSLVSFTVAKELYLRPFWSLCAVSTVKVFFVTKEATRTLRLAPTLARRMNIEGILCQVNVERCASLVSPALVTVSNTSNLCSQQLWSSTRCPMISNAALL